ncbi:hypothetical protein [Halolamina salifodinae]|uniref:UspA domain-containing protein n=1 Tax=Halolamina salifodinae TaxID=1202767 RepID=A0A8T4H381_9EURY|nr:hypothetical protein [Halolamina salifodinae]MBP1988085.1 hypothetical protein [Halolamina salifodinae]
MSAPTGSESPPLIAHLVVPMDNEDHARATTRVLKQYPYNWLTVVHVVENGGRVPDKLSVKQAEMFAEDSFAALGQAISDTVTEAIRTENI